jgi:antitoxin (DNA-binding transcriptional repressor) of toxin-antitoxin stability system
MRTINIVQNVQTRYDNLMKKISTSNARKHISSLIDEVVETGEVIAIKRHKEIDALIVKFPREYRADFSDVANLNAYSKAFEFLKDEPDDYSRSDIKQKYD